MDHVGEGEHEAACCHACSRKPRRWYHEKLLLAALGLITLYVVHVILNLLGAPVLGDLLSSLYEYAGIIWLPMTVGLLIGGLIDRFIPREYIWRFLSRHEKRGVIYSVGLGFLASACSHGILAISMELYRKGAPTAVVVPFLLASPWASLPITMLLLSLFGIMGLIFSLSAIAIAIVAGLLHQVLDRTGLVERNTHGSNINDDFSIIEDVKARWWGYDFSARNVFRDLIGVLRGSWELARMVMWWIIIGMIIAAAIKAYVPGEIFMNYLGPTASGLLATLLFAMVLEVCSEGTAPLTFEIYRQTGAFGNALVFLMAGVATDYTEIGLIWSNIGRKAALWLPTITVPQIALIGYLLNVIM